MPQALVVRVRLAWWLRPRLIGLYVAAVLTRATPDPEKVGRMIARAVRFRAG